jgi:Na+/H+ antiporter NhaD/arsenite permease-like protein
MTIASTRPVLRLAEQGLGLLARLGGGSPLAWWLSLLVAGPMLGSLITEPAAMTICAVLLSRKFYSLRPSRKLAYATLGLLFVSISTGGTLTHFAAPPVLMVANAWNWDTPFMLAHFGWKAFLGVVVSAAAYLLLFGKELRRLGAGMAQVPEPREEPVPLWVTLAHLGFMAFAVFYSHHTVHLILAFLFFLAFVEVTEEFQRDFNLRPPVLVGFFLAGLVIHGGLQQWWIAPVLGSLGETPLFLGAVFLTAFNDNAAITYLCTLVPSFTDPMKYAAVAGAVVGGGLTVIANAPNPAGQSILNKHFEDGISVGGLFLGALIPTIVQAAVFLLFRP